MTIRTTAATALLAALAITATTAFAGPAAQVEPRYFAVQLSSAPTIEAQEFIIKVTDKERLDATLQAMNGKGDAPRSVLGKVVRGRESYNSHWNFHLAPDSIGFFDFAITGCQWPANYVEDNIENLNSFLPDNTLCLTGSRVVREVIR
ncbi:hypothetical protein EC912_10694 [Luteibacter rhizovicinus]|uniref:BP74 N-terminal domain-containing protein n=1 Tax=Luteibacter rhizovicinus TaxID=242606 RepID=A0A4R3YKG4_9GAMM|nr:hypothetical protein [Luteibacter rhizovicinus]TCV92756.1 hypothetical protein EC912_10694 [Luteibacter rhizovicinus]